jgi:hypothetical protein
MAGIGDRGRGRDEAPPAEQHSGGRTPEILLRNAGLPYADFFPLFVPGPEAILSPS